MKSDLDDFIRNFYNSQLASQPCAVQASEMGLAQFIDELNYTAKLIGSERIGQPDVEQTYKRFLIALHQEYGLTLTEIRERLAVSRRTLS